MCEDSKTTEKANSNPATSLANDEVAMMKSKIAEGRVARENEVGGNVVK